MWIYRNKFRGSFIFSVKFEILKLKEKCINLLKSTGYIIHQQVFTINNFTFCHTVFMSFEFIWEPTATSAPYDINWLVFITEMKNVYCAVGIGALNKAVCASSLKGKAKYAHFFFL
jgi:hypothetical protein